MTKIDSNKIEEEYKTISSDLINFENALMEQLEKLFKDIKLGFPIQHRVKTANSIKEKHESKRYTIKKSIQELQDLVGFRIILLFKRDVNEVIKLIEENFEIINSYDTSDKLAHDQFGYSSKHLNVKIKKEWLNVPTFRGVENYTAEIQVRTLSQHNWAETSNVLQYKNEANVPKEILRTIGRVSALLETVDLELERTLNERETYVSKIDIKVNQELNIETMKVVFDKFLPIMIYRDTQNYSELLAMLEFFNIVNIEDLVNLIRNYVQFDDDKIKFRDRSNGKWRDHVGEVIDSSSSLFIYLLSHYNFDLWKEYAEKITNN